MKTSSEETARPVQAKKQTREKDASGRLLSESFCIPFILTSMGGLCDEGHRKQRKHGVEEGHLLYPVLPLFFFEQVRLTQVSMIFTIFQE